MSVSSVNKLESHSRPRSVCLVVVALLSTSVFAVSLRLSDTSTASRDSKRALAAGRRGDRGRRVPHERARAPEPARSASRPRLWTRAPAPTPRRAAPRRPASAPGSRRTSGNGSSYTYYVTPALQDGDVCAGLPVHHTDPSRRGDRDAAVRHLDRPGERRAPQGAGARRLLHRDAALPRRRDPGDQRDHGEEHRLHRRCARVERPDRPRQQQLRQRRHPARHGVLAAAEPGQRQHARRPCDISL